MNLIKFLVLILLLISFSCVSNEERRLQMQTTIFKSYLESEFNIKPGQRLEYYFTVPTMSCPGCNKAVIDNFIKFQEMDYIFLIVSDNQFKTMKQFNIQNNIFVDKKNKIDRLNLDALNTNLIIWDTNKIRSINYINPENIDSVSNSILKM